MDGSLVLLNVPEFSELSQATTWPKLEPKNTRRKPDNFSLFQLWKIHLQKKILKKKRIREIVFEMSSFQNWILKKMYASMSKQLFNMHSLHILYNDLKKNQIAIPDLIFFVLTYPDPDKFKKTKK